jgi:hypothetical protein
METWSMFKHWLTKSMRCHAKGQPFFSVSGSTYTSGMMYYIAQASELRPRIYEKTKEVIQNSKRANEIVVPYVADLNSQMTKGGNTPRCLSIG